MGAAHDGSSHPALRGGASAEVVVLRSLSLVVFLMMVLSTGCYPGPWSGSAFLPGSRARGQASPPTPVWQAGLAAVRAAAPLPSDVLDLTPWKLTLPTAGPTGYAAEVTQPALDGYSRAPYFSVTPDGAGVAFRAPVDGATTPGAKYARSELREMTPAGGKAAWSSSVGAHTMEIREAITHLPSAKPEVVAGQIHDANGYIVMVRLNGSRLFVQHNGHNIGDLDTDYHLGDMFTVRLVAGADHVRVYYNGAPKAAVEVRKRDLYFKAGCYTQSSPAVGDQPGEYGEIVIYDLRVSHQ